MDTTNTSVAKQSNKPVKKRRKRRRKKPAPVVIEEEPVLEKRIEVKKWGAPKSTVIKTDIRQKLKDSRYKILDYLITLNQARALNNGETIWFCIFRDLIIYVLLLALAIDYVVDLRSIENQMLINMGQKLYQSSKDPVLVSELTGYLQNILSAEKAVCFQNRKSYREVYDRLPIREETYVFQHSCPVVGFRVKLKVVSKKTCRLHRLSRMFFRECFDRYQERIEETTDYFAFEQLIKYTTEEDNRDTNVVGEISKYCGAGQVINIMEEALNIINIDPQIFRNGTSAVMLDLLMFNQNFNKFLHSKYIFEAPIVGGMITSHSNTVVSLDLCYKMLIFNVLDVIVTGYYLFELIKDVQYFRWKSVTHFWMMIDAVFIACNVYTFTIAMRLHYISMKYLHKANEWLKVVFIEIEYTYLAALVTGIICIKALKLIHFRIIALTLKKSVKGLIGFSFLFLVLLFCYAVIGRLMYGKCLERFETYRKAMAVLVLFLMGDINPNVMQECNRFTILYVLTYFVIVVTIILNMGLGMINDAYYVAKIEIQISPKEMDLWQYLKLKFQSKKKKDTIDYDTVIQLKQHGFKQKDIKEFLKRTKKESETITEEPEDITEQDIFKQQTMYDEVEESVDWSLEFMKDVLRYLDENEFIVQEK